MLSKFRRKPFTTIRLSVIPLFLVETCICSSKFMQQKTKNQRKFEDLFRNGIQWAKLNAQKYKKTEWSILCSELNHIKPHFRRKNIPWYTCFRSNWPKMNRNVAAVVEKGKCLDCFSLESGVEIEVWLRCIMRGHLYFQKIHKCAWMKVKRIRNHIFGLNQMNHSLNTLKVSQWENMDHRTDGYRAVRDHFRGRKYLMMDGVQWCPDHFILEKNFA